jgi:hypothetical protein
MRSLLKESQDKILELQDELRKAHCLNQKPANSLASTKPIDFLLSQQQPIINERAPQPKRAKASTSTTTKQKNTVVSDEEPMEGDQHEEQRAIQNVHANRTGQIGRPRKAPALSAIPIPQTNNNRPGTSIT